MRESTSIRGIIPPTITCFDTQGNLDFVRTREHLDFVIEAGVHGVFALGTNGEAPLLSYEEKRQVMEAVVAEAGGRVPVLLGVGASGTEETVELARHAQQSGADALAVITPFYYPLSREGALRHYRAVARAVGLPLFVYHFPQRTGNWLDPDLVRELAGIPNVQGLKDSSGDLAWAYEVRCMLPDFNLLLGNDALIYAGLAMEANGFITAVSNAFPELVVRLYHAFVDGDRERARSLQETLLWVRKAFDRRPALSAVKAVLELRGRSAGPLRGPLVTLGAGQREELKSELQALGVL